MEEDKLFFQVVLLCQQYANQHVELVKSDLAHSIPVQHVKHDHDLSPFQVRHVVKKVIEQHVCDGGRQEVGYSQTVPECQLAGAT